MRVVGVDFTSTPGRRKPIVAVGGELVAGTLRVDAIETFETLAGFEALLARPGPWIAGCDFPFGQARRFVENVGWPRDWAGCVDHAATLPRAAFRAALDAYRAPRAPGDREHRRRTDVAAGAISPQKLHGVPVALMFHEGAPRLRRAGVSVPGLQRGDPERVVVEAYPGVLARRLIGRRSYKSDTRARQDAARRAARAAIVAALADGALGRTHGVVVAAADLAPFVEDPSGDRLDALLAAVQAGWAGGLRDARHGAPRDTDPLEGWIAEPTLATAPGTTATEEST